MKTTTISCRVPHSLKESISKQAQKNGITPSNYIKECLINVNNKGMAIYQTDERISNTGYEVLKIAGFTTGGILIYRGLKKFYLKKYNQDERKAEKETLFTLGLLAGILSGIYLISKME